MNDRFKFRVYFKGSEYCEAGYQDIKREDVVFSIRADGQIIRTVAYECQREGHEKEPCMLPFTPDNNLYVIQSCTGLKDKNGKLIYEGDIVKCFHVSSTMQGRVFTGFVAYDNERCRYCILENKNCSYATFSDTDDVFEVIGNIYENKDLLNDRD